MNVTGVNRSVDRYGEAADSIYTPQAPLQTLNGARLVILTVTLTEKTHHMVGEREIAKIAPGGILVNFSRDPVLDTDVLLATLENNKLSSKLTQRDRTRATFL